MKTNLSPILVVMLFVVGAAHAQFTYTNINGTITITGYTGTNGVVVIPDVIDDLPVTTVGTNAFYGRSLTNVTIPNTVTSIGDSAFEYCTNLTSVTIPNGVTNIGGGAFSYCSSLTGVTIPISVTTIGDYAFFYCSSLTSGTIPNGVTSIGNSTFAGCSSLTSVTIPNSVTSIGNTMFSLCFSLTSVTIPNSVTSIGDHAFYLCSSLTGVTIPGSVTNIGDFAFSKCLGLTKVFFDGNSPAVGQGVFDGPNLWPLGGSSFDPATIYFLPGTTGWSTNFAGLPTAIWTPEVQTSDSSFGVKANQFGFNVTWASSLSVVVEASPSFRNPVWSPVATNTLSRGTFYFTDPQWSKYPSRFYRVRSQ
jgi:hypothetical protein